MKNKKIKLSYPIRYRVWFFFTSRKANHEYEQLCYFINYFVFVNIFEMFIVIYLYFHFSIEFSFDFLILNNILN